MFKYIKKVWDNKLNFTKEIEMEIEYKSKITYVVPNSHIEYFDADKIIEKDAKKVLMLALRREFYDEEKVKSILYDLRGNLSICEKSKLIDELEKELLPNLDLKIEKISVLNK